MLVMCKSNSAIIIPNKVVNLSSAFIALLFLIGKPEKCLIYVASNLNGKCGDIKRGM